MKDTREKKCDSCGKDSPKGLRFDMDVPREKRKWECTSCYFKKHEQRYTTNKIIQSDLR